MARWLTTLVTGLVLGAGAALADDASPPAGVDSCGQPRPGAGSPTPRPIKRTAPRYPHKAMVHDVAGTAVVLATIDADGEVTDTRIISEDPPDKGFGDAVAEAIESWTFAPGRPGVYCVTNKFKTKDPPSSVPVNVSELQPAPPPSWHPAPAYPERALDEGMTGSAEVAIYIDEDGAVTHSGLMAEEPAGYEFGLAAYYAVNRWGWKAGSFTPGTYRLRVDFAEPQRISDGAEQAQLRSLPDAPAPDTKDPIHYPKPARTKKMAGDVELAVWIDDRGVVERLAVITEMPAGAGFALAAAAGVARWRYPAYMAGGYRQRVVFESR